MRMGGPMGFELLPIEPDDEDKYDVLTLIVLKDGPLINLLDLLMILMSIIQLIQP